MSKQMIEQPDDNSADYAEPNLLSLPIQEQKKKQVIHMYLEYIEGLKLFEQKQYTSAAEYFANAVKPVLSKPFLKKLLIEDAAIIHQQIYHTSASFLEQILDSMYHIGMCNLEDDSFPNHHAKAASIFQYCASFSREHNLCSSEDYLKKAYMVEQNFLNSIGKADSICNPTTEYLKEYHENYSKQIEEYKAKLEILRTSVKDSLKDINNYPIEQICERAKIIEEIYKKCNDHFVNDTNTGIIQKLITNCAQQLGNIPPECEYSIIGLGSLSDGKMTPYSDLEFAILINDNKKEYIQYFQNLTTLLHIKIINFGETMLRSVGIELLNNFTTGLEADDWFWDEVMKSGFSFDGAQPSACKLPYGRQGYSTFKDYSLILTPKKMLNFQNDPCDQAQHNWFKSDKHLVQSLRCACLISGSQNLLDNYRELLQSEEFVAKSTTKSRAFETLKEDLNKYSLKFDDEENGKLIDVKKDIYRLADRILEALSDYFGIFPEKGHAKITAWEKINKMFTSGHLSEKNTSRLIEAISIASELRLNAYCANGSQTENIQTYIPAVSHLNKEQQKKLIEQTFHVKDTSILHHYYYIMSGLQQILKQESAVPNKFLEALKETHLYIDHNLMRGMVHARFLEYSDAIRYFDLLSESEELIILDRAYSLYLETGSIEKAQKIATRALELTLNKYKGNLKHENVAISYGNLGNIYSNNGDYNYAIKYYLKSKNILESVDTPNLQYIAYIYNNIGSALNQKGEYDNALWHLNNAVANMKLAYIANPNHPDIAGMYKNIGITFINLGEYDTAINLFQKALDIEKEVHSSNPNHINIAKSYNNIGSTYNSKKDPETALCYLFNALDIQKILYSSNPCHPNIAAIYNNIANSFQLKGEYTKAIGYQLEALDIWRKVYGSNPNHPNIAKCYTNIGNAYSENGENDNAITYQLRALNILQEVHRSNLDHPHIATIYNDLGCTYQKSRKYDKAIGCFQKARNIWTKIHHSNQYPTNIINCNKNLSLSLICAEEYNLALDYSKELFKMSGEITFYILTLILLGNQHLLANRKEEAREYYNKIHMIFQIPELNSKEFFDFMSNVTAFTYKNNILPAAISCQRVLAFIDPELKFGNHHHHLASFYASAGLIELANETFIKAFKSQFDICPILNVEYAQFLIMNLERIEAEPKLVSNLLYNAIKYQDEENLVYSIVEQNYSWAALRELIKEEKGSIEVLPKTLALYLLLKNPIYIRETDNIESLHIHWRQLCEHNLDEVISTNILGLIESCTTIDDFTM